jgi:hypothetical protein
MIERLVVSSLLVLVLGTLVPLLEIGRQSWSRVDRHVDMLQNGRRALDKMVRDLRAAQSFTTVSPALLRFTQAHGDGTGALRTVEYQVNAGGDSSIGSAADFAIAGGSPSTRGRRDPGSVFGLRGVRSCCAGAGKSLPMAMTFASDIERTMDRPRSGKDVPTAWNTTTTRLWFAVQAPSRQGAPTTTTTCTTATSRPASANGTMSFSTMRTVQHWGVDAP